MVANSSHLELNSGPFGSFGVRPLTSHSVAGDRRSGAEGQQHQLPHAGASGLHQKPRVSIEDVDRDPTKNLVTNQWALHRSSPSTPKSQKSTDLVW